MPLTLRSNGWHPSSGHRWWTNWGLNISYPWPTTHRPMDRESEPTRPWNTSATGKTIVPLAQFAFNSSKSAKGKSPFYANYGFEQTAIPEPKNMQILAQRSRMDTERLRELQKELASDLDFINAKSAIYYNKKRSEGPDLKEGDLVYLLRKNIKTTRPSSKLDHTKLGPFQIEKAHGKLTYRLKLPKDMRIHPVFHISLLEPAPPSAKPVTMSKASWPSPPSLSGTLQAHNDGDESKTFGRV